MDSNLPDDPFSVAVPPIPIAVNGRPPLAGATHPTGAHQADDVELYLQSLEHDYPAPMPAPDGLPLDTMWSGMEVEEERKYGGDEPVMYTSSSSYGAMSPDFFPSAPSLTRPPTRGPLFSNIFIAHHLHRCTPSVQDVLLQALKMKQIASPSTGVPINLPAIHLCIATHCVEADASLLLLGSDESVAVAAAAGMSGTGLTPRLRDEFVLDLQADPAFFLAFQRFVAGSPMDGIAGMTNYHRSYTHMHGMHLSNPHHHHRPHALLPIPWESIRQEVNEDESSPGIFLSTDLASYIRDIAVALRTHGRIAFGPTAQGVQALIHAAKCHAFFSGCRYVRPVDVDSVAEDGLCHRLMLRASTGPWSTLQSARLIIAHLINKTLLPPK